MQGLSMRSTSIYRGETADGQALHKSSMKAETSSTARTRAGSLHEKGLQMAMTAWLSAILFGEIAVFLLADCSWPSNLRGAGRQGGGRLLVMADMQLSDFGSYPFAPAGSLLLWLIERANDAFVRYAVAPVPSLMWLMETVQNGFVAMPELHAHLTNRPEDLSSQDCRITTVLTIKQACFQVCGVTTVSRRTYLRGRSF